MAAMMNEDNQSGNAVHKSAQKSGCGVYTFVGIIFVVLLIIVGAAVLFSLAIPHGDGGRTKSEVEGYFRDSGSQLKIDVDEAIGKTRTLQVTARGEVNSVDRAIKELGILSEAKRIAGANEWGFQGSYAITIAEGNRRLEVDFDDGFEQGVIEGLLKDDNAWELGFVRVESNINSLWFQPGACALIDTECNSKRAVGLSAVAGQQYLHNAYSVSASLTFDGVALTDDEREELHSDAQYKPVLNEIKVELDNSAVDKQQGLLDEGVRVLGDLASAGMQGVSGFPGLRVQPKLSISHAGGVFVTLETRHAEVTDDDDAPVLALVDAQARSLESHAQRLQELSTQPVEVEFRRGDSAGMKMILDGPCSVDARDDEFNRAVKALVEKC